LDSFNPNVAQRLKFAGRTYLRRQPALYRFSLKMRGVDTALFVDHDTDILSAGFGGSANSFVRRNLLLGNPGIKLSSHLHVPAQVIYAARHGIPTMLLIRHPADAVVSLTTRNKVEFNEAGLGWALREYSRYYETVAEYSEHYTAVAFKDAVEDFPAELERVNRQFNTAFKPPDYEAEESEKVLGFYTNKKQGYKRKVESKEVHELLLNDNLQSVKADAEHCYQNFCEQIGVRFWKDPTRAPAKQQS
jgi:hypothetical protein